MYQTHSNSEELICLTKLAFWGLYLLLYESVKCLSTAATSETPTRAPPSYTPGRLGRPRSPIYTRLSCPPGGPSEGPPGGPWWGSPAGIPRGSSGGIPRDTPHVESPGGLPRRTPQGPPKGIPLGSVSGDPPGGLPGGPPRGTRRVGVFGTFWAARRPGVYDERALPTAHGPPVAPCGFPCCPVWLLLWPFSALRPS